MEKRWGDKGRDSEGKTGRKRDRKRQRETEMERLDEGWREANKEGRQRFMRRNTRKEAEAVREMQGDAETLREKPKTDRRGDTVTEKIWRAGSVVRGWVAEGLGSRHAPRTGRGPIDSALGRGPDLPPITARRDAAGTHTGSERAAPIPVRARLLLPRRGLYSDLKRRALWTLSRGIHWQWLALRGRQRGALAPPHPPPPTARTTPLTPASATTHLPSNLLPS